MHIRPRPTSVVGLDIEGFGPHIMAAHLDLQERLDAAVRTATERLQIAIPPAHRQNTGDGAMLLVDGTFDLGILVAELPRELAKAIEQRNHVSTEEGRLRLRVVIHQGQVSVGPLGWQGQAVVETARLLNCAAGRNILQQSEDSSVLLLVSAEVYRDAVTERREGLDPYTFVPVVIGAAEKGKGLSGWACTWTASGPHRPGQPALPVRPTSHPDPESQLAGNQGDGDEGDGDTPTARGEADQPDPGGGRTHVGHISGSAVVFGEGAAVHGNVGTINMRGSRGTPRR